MNYHINVSRYAQYHDIPHSTVIIKAAHKSQCVLTADTLYFVLVGEELWGDYCEDCG